MGSAVLLTIEDMSHVSEARRAGEHLAALLDFDDAGTGRTALVITELATNLLKHARGGMLLLQPMQDQASAHLQVLALDYGKGMANVGECLRDGYSTAGSPGTGLGAVFRLADHAEVYTQVDRGTVVLANVGGSNGRPAGGEIEYGALLVPKPSESVSGDGWMSGQRGGHWKLLVSDGLGHGPCAANASQEAMGVFIRHVDAPPAELLRSLHAGLRGTRGAAAAVVDMDLDRRVVTYCGVGNIAASIVHDGVSRSLVSLPGILGHEARRYQEFTYPWPAEGLLVVHSDGLSSQWNLGAYPGLAGRHPALIAGVLFRDHRRSYDDVTIVVVRWRHP